MIWLTKQDFEKQIKVEYLNKIIGDDDLILEETERAALAELKTYLRLKYDLEQIVGTEGEERDALLLTLCVDIALFHLHSRLNPMQIPEIRKLRYDYAKEMLQNIAEGKLDPGLPFKVDEQGKPTGKLKFGSDKRRTY